MDLRNPNAMSFDETRRMVATCQLRMVVDQGAAITAVRSGLPLSAAGKIANILLVVSPILALVFALVWSWWSLPIGLAFSIGNFRIARAECVRAVKVQAFLDARIFDLLRKNEVVRFEFSTT